MSSCCCGTSPTHASQHQCPSCNTPTVSVPATAPQFLLTKEAKYRFDQSFKWFACTNPDCVTLYVDSENRQRFQVSDAKRTIWFKNGSEPKIACYCNRISFNAVHVAVQENGLTSWKEIVLKYRQQATCKCDCLNPLGVCCTEVFYGEINKALKALGKEPVSIPDSCC